MQTFLASGLLAASHWDGIGFPFSHCFFVCFFRIRELWEDNATLLEKPVVQVLRNAEICLKTGTPATHACCYISLNPYNSYKQCSLVY